MTLRARWAYPSLRGPHRASRHVGRQEAAQPLPDCGTNGGAADQLVVEKQHRFEGVVHRAVTTRDGIARCAAFAATASPRAHQ